MKKARHGRSSSGYDLRGKVVVVTGAARGIGRALALAFAQSGATVVLAGRPTPRMSATQREASKYSPKSVSFPVDVRSESAVQELFAFVASRFGRVDVLINNAGTNFPGPVVMMKSANWDEIIEGYLKGTYLCSREACGLMKKRRQGHIINIGSTASRRYVPLSAPYCAAKQGLLGFTHSFAEEVKADGIKVSLLSPGRVATDGWKKIPTADLKQMLIPDDVAEAALFIATRGARVVINELQLTHTELR